MVWAIMKLEIAKMKIVSQEMFSNYSYPLFGKADVQELHKNKEELSSLLIEKELIPLLMSITGVWRKELAKIAGLLVLSFLNIWISGKFLRVKTKPICTSDSKG